MKKILEIREEIPGIIIIRLEATKRRKLWMKVIDNDFRTITVLSACDPQYCPLYHLCSSIPSPLKKYKYFAEFCNNLFIEYPDLPFLLATNFRVFSINQVIPIKFNNNEKSNRNKEGRRR